VFAGCGEVVVTNDLVALSPDWIVFSGCSGVVTLRGNKIVLPDGGKISSFQESDATMPVMDLAVEYEKSIAVDGGVNFKRGVTGVDVVGVSRYIGHYVLTTDGEWTGSGVIESGSSVTVGKFYAGSAALTIAEGGAITTAVARVADGACMVVKNDGLFVVTDTLTVGSESAGDVTRWTSNEGSKGSFVFNRIRLLGKDGSYAYMFLNARDTRGVTLADFKSYVVGPGGIQANNSYLSIVPGWWPTPIRCCADYSIEVNEGGASKPMIGAAYASGGGLYLDTSDWQDASVGHTITVKGQLQKKLNVGVLGCGTLHFAGSSTFSNGLEIKDTATLAIDDGVMPGAGNVTMNAGTTLALPDYSGNPVQVEGQFSTSGSGEVHVKLGDGMGMRSGTYPIVTAKGGFGSVNLVLDGLFPWQEATFSTDGNTINVTINTVVEDMGWIYSVPGYWNYTGTWSEGATLGDDKVTLESEASYTAANPSDGQVVTLNMTLSFDDANDDDVDLQDAKAAVRLGADGDNFVFQLYTWDGSARVWTNATTEVNATTNTDYTFLLVLDLTNKTYTASILTGNGATTNALSVGGSTTIDFACQAAVQPVQRIDFIGSGTLTSLTGSYEDALSLFVEGESVTLSGGSYELSAGEAAWLNAYGIKAAVSAVIAGLTSAQLSDAYLLNLDITGEFSYTFTVSDIDVGDGSVQVEVTLTRSGALVESEQLKPINGTLSLSGTSALGTAFAPVAVEALTFDGNKAFADGKATSTTTVTVDTTSSGAKFYKAVIQ